MVFAAAAQLVACDNTPDNTDDPGNDDPVTSGGKSTYVVNVKTEGGIPASEEITVYIYDEDGDIKDFKEIDENGNAVFELKSSPNYSAVLYDVPEGYKYEEKYPLGTTGVTITLYSGVIADESIKGVDYKLGDIIRDFTLTDSEGQPVKLSEVLKTKKAVLLNFWFINCGYCVKEFPGLNEAYKKYSDDIEVIAINTGSTDTISGIKDFKDNFPGVVDANGYPAYYDSLRFTMVKDTSEVSGVNKNEYGNAIPGIIGAFGYNVAPVSIMIDRYGMISLINEGEMTQNQFENMFEYFTSDNFKQQIFNSISELVPKEKPTVSAPSSEEIANTVNKGDVNAEYLPEVGTADAEYSWPFVITKKNGISCITPSNGAQKIHNSYAIMHAKVTLKAGEAFVFDFLSKGTDVLYVLVDGKDIIQISGVNSDWKEACAWVALEDGTYDVAFTYLKDDSDAQTAEEGGGTFDDIYLTNFRVIDKSEVKATSYIFRFAATKLNEYRDDYLEYVDVFLNQKDGYYHVGSVDGPILVARLITNSPFSDIMGIDSVAAILNSDFANGGFTVNGRDRTASFLRYCNYASNSKVYTYCSVTEELAEYLKLFVEMYGFDTHDKTWLQLCAYYDAYGLDENGEPAPQLEDIIKGLSAHSAYEAVLGTDNTVEYIGTGMIPRGFLYKFVPQTSGVYRITTFNTNQQVEGWLFIGSDEEWLTVEDGRILYASGEDGERICSELLIPNGDGTYSLDNKNVSLVAYMEAGTPYYFDFAFNDLYGVGTFNFEIRSLGATYDYFVSASPGPFTFEELPGEEIGDTIALGIDTVLGDDGYYYHKLADGSKGSLIYADFSMVTSIFTSNSIMSTLKSHPYAFNFSMTDNDFKAVTAWNEAGKDINALRAKWGANFDTYWAEYKMDDIIVGKYHGNGPDYTDELKAYLEKMINDENAPMELNGCVAVDERLAEILQDIVGRYTFENVAGAWRKMCYYYRYLGRE